jgi:hypothetical protein
VADRNTPQKLVWRSRIVLLSADRVGKMAIVRAVGKCKRTVPLGLVRPEDKRLKMIPTRWRGSG